MELLPLVVENAQLRRRGKVLIGPVTFTLHGAGTTMVIGPNGSGKTSLLRMLHGIARLHSGTIRWACSTAEAQKRQAFVFQTPVMLRRTVRDNLIYPLRLVHTPQIEARRIAEVWADRVGLSDTLDRPANVLSGGERQKLALARAMVRGPAVLFLDEPCAALDGRATREIETLLREIVSTGTRIIMSTHNMGQARRLGTELAFVLNGRLHEFGPAPAIFDHPQTPELHAFLKGDIVE